MKNILLIEPDYKNKYPPLGLMKICTYHKQKGDNVVFYKGCSAELKKQLWDRIYISTLFTFYWDKTIKTIKFYSESVKHTSNIFVGGVMATLMKSKIQDEINVTIVEGLLNEKGKLGYKDDDKIDCILPDHSIIDSKFNHLLEYSYPTNDSYIAYATRGCIRKCKFCAVPIIEPIFTNSISIAKQVKAIKDNFGGKRHLLLLDNNILASEEFPKIIDEIKSIGFERGAKYILNTNGKKVYLNRYVDFNQGIDARLLTKEKMRLLSEIAIKPLRIAFDDIKYKYIYIEKVKLAAEHGIKTLSNYVLFNFKDTPEDFYERLKINVELNEEFERKGYKSKIWSFPMKYSPIGGEFCKNRKYIGEHWNKKYLRGVQCILLATHGVVGPQKQFFGKAFGKDVKEFLKILTLPENFIIYRNSHLNNGDRNKLDATVNSLNKEQKNSLMKMILANDFNNIETQTNDKYILDILKLYKVK
ncbi:MAG: cobalamin-binding domain-containing protein [Thermodesulfovibrio sp.]|nr:cobalamin-binding domain-containing protein [Thermodesulfovibrio sp.]